jgi:transcription elongation factor Elf1
MKEILWHFTCLKCNGWWSIAVMDNWQPKKLFCPHCGDPYVYDEKLDIL